MEVRSEFRVPAPPAGAYRFLIDLEQVAPCMPGGELGPANADGVYPARVTVKLGPMRLAYEGTLEVVARDPASLSATLLARAREARGAGTARATMTLHVSAHDAGSRVEVVTDLELRGRAAQMGRGIVEDVARRLVEQMADCLAARAELLGEAPGQPDSLAPSPPALSGLSLLGALALERLRRLLRAGRGRR